MQVQNVHLYNPETPVTHRLPTQVSMVIRRHLFNVGWIKIKNTVIPFDLLIISWH